MSTAFTVRLPFKHRLRGNGKNSPKKGTSVPNRPANCAAGQPKNLRPQWYRNAKTPVAACDADVGFREYVSKYIREYISKYIREYISKYIIQNECADVRLHSLQYVWSFFDKWNSAHHGHPKYSKKTNKQRKEWISSEERRTSRMLIASSTPYGSHDQCFGFSSAESVGYSSQEWVHFVDNSNPFHRIKLVSTSLLTD